MSKRVFARAAAGVVAAALALVPACSDGGGDEAADVIVDDGRVDGATTGEPVAIEPAARFAAAVEHVEQASSFRFDMKMWMVIATGGQRMHIQPELPVATGSLAGGRTHVAMDFGVLFAEMAEQFGPGGREQLDAAGLGDLTMEMITDGDVLYLRAPMLAALAPMMVGQDPAMAGAFASLGEGWGRLDLAALGGALPSQLAGQLTGTQAMDPTQMLALLRDAGGEVRELGRTSVRGVEVTGLAGEISLQDMAAAQGMDLDSFLESFASDADMAGVVGALAAVKVPIAVYVDAGDLVRRIELNMDLAELMAAVPELAPEMAGSQFEFSVTMDVFDHGDGTITVTPPDPATTSDLGPAFASLYRELLAGS